MVSCTLCSIVATFTLPIFLPILELTASVIEKVTADGNAPTSEALIMVDPVIRALCLCYY